MIEPAVLEEWSEEEVLVAAGACAETIRDAEADLLKIAYQWAILHGPDRLDPADAAKPGRQRARQVAGNGTPWVCEFAGAELGARIGRSTHAGQQLIADALDLHHRLPQLWGRVRGGEVRASYARHVAARTRELEMVEAGYVDAGVVEAADGRIPWTRFETLVEAKVAQAAPEAAREREERAAKARFAKKCHGEAHGMASFLVRADVATINALETAVATYAQRLAPLMPDATEDERRVYAVLLLICGQAHLKPADTTPAESSAQLPVDLPMELPEQLPDVAELLPAVQLFVHYYAGPDREEIGRVEGHGPVTETWVRQMLGPQVRFKIQPVLDLAGQAPVDAYEIPERHRQAVHLMTPADTFPYASGLDRLDHRGWSMQVDHTLPFDQGGASGIGNYGPMTTTHHRIKTHAGWRVQQPFPGIYLWRDPHGAYYLVDHTGTRPLRHAA